MFLTIIGGIIFVGSQGREWASIINGDYGAQFVTSLDAILQHTKLFEKI